MIRPRPFSVKGNDRRASAPQLGLTDAAPERAYAFARVAASLGSLNTKRVLATASEKAPAPAWRRAALFCAVAVAFVARPATGAEVAILRNGFSIRHEHRLVMGTTTRLYLGVDDSSFTDVPTAEITGFEKDLSLPLSVPMPAKVPGDSALTMATTKSAPALPLNQVVNSASATYHLDPDLVNSVIHAESGFNSHAVSPKGARGLMQLMPDTASQLGVNDAFDPQANVTGGSRYLRELLERYNFDLVKALAAYNAGPQRVEQYRGVPPFRETRAYVARIVHEYNAKKIAQEKEAKQKQAAAKATTRSRRPAKSDVAVSSPH
jgi:soluble lytic murein transglycosylase-like protein